MKIAVVVPCRNEQANIKECIDAIYASELAENIQIQVYVVDGMSADSTLSIISELQKIHLGLVVVENRKQLTPFAFNLGIKAGFECDFFQIVGARQVICADYLQKAMNRLQENSTIWCTGGKVENVYLNKVGEIIATAMGSSFGMGLGNFRTLDSSGFVDTVGTPMYPKFVFEKIDYFDEQLIRNQDDDFNFRVTNAGGKIFYDHEISLKYYVRGNFKGLWKQFFQYGYWKVFVNKKHKAVTTLRQLIPPLFVMYLFFLLFVPFLPIVLAALALFPILTYVILACYFSIKSTRLNPNIRFVEVLKTFPVLHISYGLGYLNGIFAFFLFNKRPSEKQKEMSR